MVMSQFAVGVGKELAKDKIMKDNKKAAETGDQ